MYDSHNYIKKKTKTTSILAVPDELTGQVAQPHNCGRQQVLLLGECDNLHSFTIPMGIGTKKKKKKMLADQPILKA